MAAARALYRKAPEVAAGFVAEDYEEDPVEIWAENLEVVNTFIAMGTQWRIGMGGATGLDYTALESALRLMAFPRKRWPEMFEDIRLMEEAALNEMQGKTEDTDG